MRKIIYGILLVFWMGVIFTLSNQTADKSSKLSDGFISNTIGVVYKVFNKNASDIEITYVKEIFTFPVRKAAHATIYLILGILSFLFLSQFNISPNNLILFSFLICFLYSCCDEVHQLFILDRSGEVRDVILDSLGGFIGVRIAYYRLFKK